MNLIVTQSLKSSRYFNFTQKRKKEKKIDISIVLPKQVDFFFFFWEIKSRYFNNVVSSPLIAELLFKFSLYNYLNFDRNC